MKCCKILRRLSRSVSYAARKLRLRFTILRAGLQDSTSEKTSACSAVDATGKFITYPVKLVSPKDKSSTLKDYAIRFSGRQERWPACAIAIVWLMVVSLFLAGHLIVEGVVFLLGEMK